jgi:hypothetical protein
MHTLDHLSRWLKSILNTFARNQVRALSLVHYRQVLFQRLHTDEILHHLAVFFWWQSAVGPTDSEGRSAAFETSPEFVAVQLSLGPAYLRVLPGLLRLQKSENRCYGFQRHRERVHIMSHSFKKYIRRCS